MRWSAAPSVLSFVVCLASGCGTDEGILARVGSGKVEVATFQEHLVAATGEPWQGVTDPVASRLLDQFLDQEVVVVAANQEDQSMVPTEPGARSARVRQLIEGLCGPPPPPEGEEVEAEIIKSQAVIQPARAHVRQMLLDTREDAEAARTKLDEGADFVLLSREVSRAPNASGGGELGLLTKGGLSENLDKEIFALMAGEISEPVPGPSGYHIFQVLEVFPAGPAPREEIEPEVLRRLGEIAARRHASACVRKLAGEVGVTVIHELLWFRYDGRYSEVIHAS
jgi:peptidyl-prolyl cis-trans isomerase C